MKHLILPVIALALGAVSTAPASTFTFTNDPTQFSDSIDWCQFGACNISNPFGVVVDTPTPWVSASGTLTGTTGGFYTADPVLSLQQDVSWAGDFNPGMGVLWNYPAGPSGNDISIRFDRLVYGAGAYVQPDWPGEFTATIAFFNDVHNILDFYTWSGVAGGGPGTAIFIGGFSSDQDIYGATFEVVDQHGNVDFAIGQASVQATPEPATGLLVAASLLGVGLVVGRKRRSWEQYRSLTRHSR